MTNGEGSEDADRDRVALKNGGVDAAGESSGEAAGGEKRKKEAAGDDSSNSEADRPREKNGTDHSWQAVWDTNSQRWYFWNAATQETTWENPLEEHAQPSGVGTTVAAGSGKGQAGAESLDSHVESESNLTDEEVAVRSGIDPDLAYLDPVMYAAEVQQARTAMRGGGTVQDPTALSSSSSSYRAAGAFDSRTGKFVPLEHVGRGAAHDPSRLTHANQADRQMSAFFDVEAYNEQRVRQHREAMHRRAVETGEVDGGGGNGGATSTGKRKHDKAPPTRKELRMYKERAKGKKASKYAWLRE